MQTGDGGYIIVGTSLYDTGFDDVFVIKTDFNGTVQWGNIYGGPDREVGTSIDETIYGGYIVGGYSNRAAFIYDEAYLLKLDMGGWEEWSQTYPGMGFGTYGYSVVETMDQGFALVGEAFDGYINYMYLLKTDSNGYYTPFP